MFVEKKKRIFCVYNHVVLHSYRVHTIPRPDVMLLQRHIEKKAPLTLQPVFQIVGNSVLRGNLPGQTSLSSKVPYQLNSNVLEGA